MNALQPTRRNCARFVPVAALGLMLSLPCVAHAATVGHLILYVRGNVSDIALVDPLGRTDRDDDEVSKEGIPGCSRWPGGIKTGEEDSPSADSSANVLMMFELSSVQYGRYVVCVRADSVVEVTVSATFEPEPQSTSGCIDLARTYTVGPGRHGWAIHVRRAPPKGECAVRIAPLVKKKRAAKSR